MVEALKRGDKVITSGGIVGTVERIIDNETEILQFNQNCTFPSDSQFLFGINLPDQALVKSDYDPKGDQFNLNHISAYAITVEPKTALESYVNPPCSIKRSLVNGDVLDFVCQPTGG